MKYINKYKSHEDYTKAYPELSELSAHVSLVVDNCGLAEGAEGVKQVRFSSMNYGAWVGDLLCWNKIDKEWQILKVEHNVDTALDLPDNLVPDAICVVPACHTEDGKARWCALNDVTNESLKYGSASSYVTGGHYFQWAIGSSSDPTTPAGSLVDELPLYGVVPKLEHHINDDNDFYYINKVTGVTFNRLSWYAPTKYISELMPFGQYSGDFSDFGRIEGYPVEVRATLHGTGRDPYDDYDGEPSFTSGAVHPYLPDENGNLFGKNALAFLPVTETQENGNVVGNAFLDLAGLKNTQILLKLSPTGKEYPAVLAASLYSQEYSPAGTWYLPAAGELAYLWSMWYIIQHTLYRLSDKHVGNYSASPLDCGNNYWTSSQYSADSAVNLNTYYGCLDWLNKYNDLLVRPFRSF